MLRLSNITKDYQVADETVHALKGVSLNFRRNEFVSILGASGCGKSTLLNIIGGLDHYTSGDLVIKGTSTKEFKDRNWDTYRNHSIGFIFQSYHLIPHQTILQNVELALMISGVSKRKRRKRAIEALEKVGLGDKINNKPNQLSGGQAQRVAIARALINNPEIVLADEPTGALDSKTSVQIMELLKEIAKDRLVIMVTHNPELAEKYSTRIVKLFDGQVTSDSRPFTAAQEKAEVQAMLEEEGAFDKKKKKIRDKSKGSKKQSSMSAFMAFSLSGKNLLSKGKRTAMVSVAGSIGIVGVSLVLAISAGVHGYIDTMENDMLSGYPISITQSSVDFSSLMSLSQDGSTAAQKQVLSDLKKNQKINVNSLLKTLGSFSTGFQTTNNITKEYIEYIDQMPAEYTRVIQYGYGFNIVNNLYTDFTVRRDLNSTSVRYPLPDDFDAEKNTRTMSVTAIRSMYSSILQEVPEYSEWGSMISTVDTFAEVPANYDYIMEQYDVVAIDRDGQVVTDDFTDDEVKALFNAKESLVMVLSNGKIDDLTLAQYGYFTEDEFLDYANAGIDKTDEGEAPTTLVGADGLPFDMFIGGKTFTYYPNDTIYYEQEVKNVQYTAENFTAFLEKNNIALPESYDSDDISQLVDMMNENDEASLQSYLSFFGVPEQVIGVVIAYMQYEQENTSVTKLGYGAYAYSDGSADYDAFASDKSVNLNVKLILQKKDSVSYGCLDSGFYYTNALTQYILETEKESKIVSYINGDGTEGSEGTITSIPYTYDFVYVDADSNTYKNNTASGKIGGTSSVFSTIVNNVSGATESSITAGLLGGDDTPTAIYFYATDFDSKESITTYLDAWNDTHEVEDQITYSDTVGMIISMVNTMISMITIALICFTALSLVVSTVMIGIITYVSVVERVKEIGILRAVGARKKDIKRLFNAETFIIGLLSGVAGILITYILSGIIDLIVGILTGIYTIAALPLWQAAVMIGVSVVLTLISGLIPASAAAKKDPVDALRTE